MDDGYRDAVGLSVVQFRNVEFWGNTYDEDFIFLTASDIFFFRIGWVQSIRGFGRPGAWWSCDLTRTR